MRPRGFTLLELLVVVAILGVLLGLILWYLEPVRKRANLVAGLSYAKSVAMELEALKDLKTGAPPTSFSDCMTGFGARPAAVTGCTVEWQGLDPKITLTLRSATHSTVIYEGATGTLSTLP